MAYPPPPPPADGDDADAEPVPGDTYAGAMSHGARHGRGTYTWGASGARYSGDYVAGAREGQGTMTFPDKSRYEGAYRARAPARAAFMRYNTAGVCSHDAAVHIACNACALWPPPTCWAHSMPAAGAWAADKMEGQGTYTYPNGDVFSGSFRGGVKDGRGVYHCKVHRGACRELAVRAGSRCEAAATLASTGAGHLRREACSRRRLNL